LVFSSAVFLFIFLPTVFLIYRVLPGMRSRNMFLACASVVFFSFGQLVYVPIFLGSVLINYISGLLLMKHLGRKRLILAAAVILNLGILCFFKYTDFIIGNINAVAGSDIDRLGLALPIGISFYTFQGLSYTIDVSRDPSEGTKSFSKLLLYISFFPQLIAGPIVKYHDISLQIDERTLSPEETANGIRRFIAGLSKKLLIANAAGYIADRVFNNSLFADHRLAWLGAVCYMIQIYYDFSGYSDMAIGIGHMFGFTIHENFLHPYGADSMTVFWRRWHISLSTWFREYLYIPLGGNRRGKLRTAINRIIVFFCTGLWHGANWTFVVWGLGHGLLTSLENLGIIPVKKLQKNLLGRILCRIYVLLAVTLLFVIFRADSLSVSWQYISAMFSCGTLTNGAYTLATLLSPAACVTLAFAVILAGNIPEAVSQRLGGTKLLSGAIPYCISVVLLALCIMSLSGGGFNPFIYFQF